MFEKALQAYKSGDLETAQRSYQKILKRQPRNADAHQLLALVYQKKKQLKLAEKHLRKSLELVPQQAHVHNNLGNCLRRQNRLAAAIKHYQKAIAQQADYVDAIANLARTYCDLAQEQKAIELIDAATQTVRENSEILRLQGRAYQQLDKYEQALACFDKALQQDAGNTHALHGRALTLRLAGRPAEAVPILQQLAAGPAQADAAVFHNLGNARSDLGELAAAGDAYRQALLLAPTKVETHQNLAALRWTQGDQSGFLDSYVQAFANGHSSLELHASYANRLLLAGRAQQAVEVIAALSTKDREQALMLDLHARCLRALEQFEQALELHALAVKKAPEDLDYLAEYVCSLVQLERTQQAEAVLADAPELHQQNPLFVAWQATCWRANNNSAETQVNNYQSFVRVYDLFDCSAPTDLAFNTALLQDLIALHTSSTHPIDQTLRFGTQTRGNLFAMNTANIKEFVQQVEAALARYQSEMEALPVHPRYVAPKVMDYAGSWSVRLGAQGFHTSHVHPMGSISGVYYLELPDELGDALGEELGDEAESDEADKKGWLKFGEPPIADAAKKFPAQYYVQPKIGQLILFPSYFWHGTVPFESQQNRTTIAFDLAREQE